MYYSENDIEEIVKQINIIDVISRYIKLEKVSSIYFGKCPFHEDESMSFMVHPEKQTYYCFGCGCGGNVITFLMEYNHISFTEAVQSITKKEEPKNDQLTKEKDSIIAINRETVNFYQNELKRSKKGIDYAAKRELKNETIEKFHLGFSCQRGMKLYKHLVKCGYSKEEIERSGVVGFYEDDIIRDKFYNRFMFPIQNHKGEFIGFGGRAMVEGNKKIPKYLNSSETLVFNKSCNLYGLNFALETDIDHFILCEGYMDVISLHQSGFTNAVASLGTAFTVEQAKLLKHFRNKVYLAYDSDGPGANAAAKAGEALKKMNMEGYVIDMNPYKDPDEFIKGLGREAFKIRIKQALPYDDWMFKMFAINIFFS